MKLTIPRSRWLCGTGKPCPLVDDRGQMSPLGHLVYQLGIPPTNEEDLLASLAWANKRAEGSPIIRKFIRYDDEGYIRLTSVAENIVRTNSRRDMDDEWREEMLGKIFGWVGIELVFE